MQQSAWTQFLEGSSRTYGLPSQSGEMAMNDQARLLQFVQHVGCCEPRIHLQEPDVALSQDKVDSKHTAQAGVVNKNSCSFKHLFESPVRRDRPARHFRRTEIQMHPIMAIRSAAMTCQTNAVPIHPSIMWQTWEHRQCIPADTTPRACRGLGLGLPENAGRSQALRNWPLIFAASGNPHQR